MDVGCSTVVQGGCGCSAALKCLLLFLCCRVLNLYRLFAHPPASLCPPHGILICPALQVVVALLEPLQEGGAVSAAAIRVLEELVLVCKRNHRDKLRTMPPLPNWMKELEQLNEVRQM